MYFLHIKYEKFNLEVMTITMNKSGVAYCFLDYKFTDSSRDKCSRLDMGFDFIVLI